MSYKSFRVGTLAAVLVAGSTFAAYAQGAGDDMVPKASGKTQPVEAGSDSGGTSAGATGGDDMVPKATHKAAASHKSMKHKKMASKKAKKHHAM